MTHICPACGKEHKAAMICPWCGTKMPPKITEAIISPKNHPDFKPNFCIYCGKKLEGKTICPGCGAKVQKPTAVIISPNLCPPDYSKILLFVDTETAGLPMNRYATVYSTSNWPRLVEIAWVECYEDGTIISEYNTIIKPDSYEIPLSASAIHGITTERATKEGVPIEPILKKFHNSVLHSSIIIGHNINFDTKVILAEYIRAGLIWLHIQFLTKKQICTMKSTKNFCRIRTGKGYYKYPKLSELHKKLFGKPFRGEHSALKDVKMCMKCYFELKKRGKI